MEIEEELRKSLPQLLKFLGFTKYEALVYVALLSLEGATATEIHEASGVPRASVYPVLDRLVEKNLVTVSTATPRRFSAVPPDEAIDRLLLLVREDAMRAKQVLNEIYRSRVTAERGDQELIWSIRGEEKIITRLRELVGHARERILVMSHLPLVRRILIDEPGLLAPGVRVEAICNTWEGPVPPNAEIHVKDFDIVDRTHADLPGHDMSGIFMVDGEKAMIIMGMEGEVPTALYSESPGFLRFFSSIWELNLAWAAPQGRK